MIGKNTASTDKSASHLCVKRPYDSQILSINIKQNIIEQEIILSLYHAHIKRADIAVDTCKRPIM